MRTGGLTEITAPKGITLTHKRLFLICKIALALSDGRKAITPLSSKNTRRTGALTSAASLASLDIHRLYSTEKLGLNIGYNVSDKYITAVFFVNDKSVITCYTKT